VPGSPSSRSNGPPSGMFGAPHPDPCDRRATLTA
jgi:hypothetical protein